MDSSSCHMVSVYLYSEPKVPAPRSQLFLELGPTHESSTRSFDSMSRVSEKGKIRSEQVGNVRPCTRQALALGTGACRMLYNNHFKAAIQKYCSHPPPRRSVPLTAACHPSGIDSVRTGIHFVRASTNQL